MTVLCLAAGNAAAQDLKTYQSRHYLIHSSLKPKEVCAFGKHMDTVFVQFQDRFREFHTRDIPQMPLYLLGTEPEYQRFMRSQDINAANTGGMFSTRRSPRAWRPGHRAAAAARRFKRSSTRASTSSPSTTSGRSCRSG